MKNRIGQFVCTGIIAAALLASAPAFAHHSAAVFDAAQSKVLDGTIKKVDWTNPHTWFWIEVKNDKGAMDTWGVEGMSPNFLERRGWTRKTLKPGDKLTITIRPAKDGSMGGMWVTAKRPNGEVLSMTGPVTNP
jgi:hypothetical protein